MDTEPQSLAATLFRDEWAPATIIAVLDGTSSPGLPERLAESGAEHHCLYAGNIHPNLAAVAPYLAVVTRESALLRWIVDPAWSTPFGILAEVGGDTPLSTVRRHLRSLLRVKGDDGRPILFRYYDPRVLDVTLASIELERRSSLFGPFVAFIYPVPGTGGTRRAVRRVEHGLHGADDHRPHSKPGPVAIAGVVPCALGAPVREALAASAETQFASGTLRYLEEVAPDWFRATPRAEREQLVHSTVALGRRHNLRQGISLRRLAYLAAHYGLPEPLPAHMAHRVARADFPEAQRLEELLGVLSARRDFELLSLHRQTGHLPPRPNDNTAP